MYQALRHKKTGEIPNIIFRQTDKKPRHEKSLKGLICKELTA